MSIKKIISLYFIISLIGFTFGLILNNSIELNICSLSEPTCINSVSHISDTLIYGMSALSIVFFILLFFPQSFPAWKKFAIWFIPIATLLFIFYKGPSSGDLFSPYPEQVFKWVSGLYVLLSLLIIFRARRQ